MLFVGRRGRGRDGLAEETGRRVPAEGAFGEGAGRMGYPELVWLGLRPLWGVARWGRGSGRGDGGGGGFHHPL